MTQTVSDFFWERLRQWGVRRIFGYRCLRRPHSRGWPSQGLER